MWLMLQQNDPEDFVIATGQKTSVRDFVRMAFAEIGVTLKFKGQGVEEVGFVAASQHPEFALNPGMPVLAIDKAYYRPTEVELLIGDASKARQKLGWAPQHSLQDMIREMVAADLELFRRDKLLQDSGFSIKNQSE
jgi:GDPmannose 4,6-dehydratase